MSRHRLLTSVSLLAVLGALVSFSVRSNADDVESELISTLDKLYSDGKYNAVVELSSKALKVGVKNQAGVLTYRGLAWLEKGEYDISLKDFDEVLRLAPKLGLGYLSRGRCKAAKRDHDKAIDDYNMAIRLDSNNARAWIFRGISWQAKGQQAKAESDFKRAHELDPKLFKDLKK